MRALVVESDPESRAEIELALVLRGMIVVTARTSAGALSAHAREPADLFVLDGDAPDALESIVALRSHPAPQPRILVVFARSEPLQVGAALDAGADDFALRPLAAAMLEMRLRVMARTAPRRTGSA